MRKPDKKLVRFLRQNAEELRHSVKGKTFQQEPELFKDIESLKARIRQQVNPIYEV